MNNTQPAPHNAVVALPRDIVAGLITPASLNELDSPLLITWHARANPHALSASDPISTMLGNNHHAPLHARRVTADVHPPAATRGDLHSDRINLHHPSARTDLQSPVSLTKASPTHAPALIDNHYITGVHSSNSSTSSS